MNMLNFDLTCDGGWGMGATGLAVVIGLTGITFLNNAILCNMHQVDGLSPQPSGGNIYN